MLAYDFYFVHMYNQTPFDLKTDW